MNLLGNQNAREHLGDLGIDRIFMFYIGFREKCHDFNLSQIMAVAVFCE
jgi:hypothetical protein